MLHLKVRQKKKSMCTWCHTLSTVATAVVRYSTIVLLVLVELDLRKNRKTNSSRSVIAFLRRFHSQWLDLDHLTFASNGRII